jgi:type I restriction enzyme R subunit
VQQRVKDHKYSNEDYKHEKKIDVLIVVDMLLTGFDSKFLNTLYVDKNLDYHRLIQAFSRTNRILNDSKPYGNILDFRQQQTEVDQAISLFSGKNADHAKEIWLVDPAPSVIEKYEKAVVTLNKFMEASNLVCEPHEVYNLKGDATKITFINHFKEVQRLKTQLDQYTDLNPEQKQRIETIISEDRLREFRSSYLETAKLLKEKQQKESNNTDPAIQQLDFEFVLFASAVIDYDYIMGLIAKYTQDKPSKQTVSRKQLINLLSSSANLMEERDDIVDYINNLQTGNSRTLPEIHEGYQAFKAEKNAAALATVAQKNGLQEKALQDFVDGIMNRMIFDGEKLSELLGPLDLGWKARTQKELDLMNDLVPLLNKLAQGREISGLKAYE